MKINVFNTGREYTESGQRIAWAELLRETSGSHIVGFYDADRRVYNVVRVTSTPTDEKVLEQYDQCNYLRSFILPQAVADALQDRAKESV